MNHQKGTLGYLRSNGYIKAVNRIEDLAKRQDVVVHDIENPLFVVDFTESEEGAVFWKKFLSGDFESLIVKEHEHLLNLEV